MADKVIHISVNPSFESVAKQIGSIGAADFMKGQIKILAELIASESKRVTPVDTGRLRASIAVDMKPLGADISPNIDYDIYVHEGTRFMRPRPFMEWGVSGAVPRWEGIFERNLEELLRSKLA